MFRLNINVCFVFFIVVNSLNAQSLTNLDWLKKENTVQPISLKINNKIVDIDKNTTEIIHYFHQDKPYDYFFFKEIRGVWTKNKECAENLKKNLYRLRPDDKLIELPADLSWSENPFNDRNWEYWFHSWRITDCLTGGYVAFQDEWYIERLKWLVSDWWKDNFKVDFPSQFSWNDLTLANRLENIMKIFEYLRRREKLDEKFTQVALRSIYWHSRILAEEEKLYIKNTNHGLVQANILFQVSQIFPEFALSSSWKNIGEQRLRNEINFAMTKEGVHKENSPSYHAWVSAYCVKANNFSEHYTGNVITSDGENLQEGGLKFLTTISRPDRTLPILGDTREGIYTKSQYPNLEEIPGYLAYQYLISKGEKGVKPEETVALFQESGYYIYRDKWDEPGVNTATQLIFKCGYLARSHRHNDDGNVLLYGLGEDWLIDAGVFGYQENEKRYRRYALSPSAHNISFPYSMKDSRPSDYRMTNSLENRFNNYADNWGLIDASDNYALCESHMYKGFTYKRKLEVIGEQSFRLTDELVSENLKSDSENKFVTLFRVPDDKKIYINTDKKIIMVLNDSGSTGMQIKYQDFYDEIRLYRGGEADILSLETSGWLQMSPIQTIAFIRSGTFYSANYEIGLVGSPNIHNFERMLVGATKTELDLNENSNNITITVRPKWENVQMAFYLYKDGERIDIKWYGKEFYYTIDKRKYGPGEYKVKYFIVDEDEINPGLVDKKESGYSESFTISRTGIRVIEEANTVTFLVSPEWENVQMAFYLYRDGEHIDTKWYGKEFYYTLDKSKYGPGEYKVKYFIVDEDEVNPGQVDKKELGYSESFIISKAGIRIVEEANTVTFLVSPEWENVQMAFYLYKDGERIDIKWYSKEFYYTLDKSKYGSGEYKIKYSIVDENEVNPGQVDKKESGYSESVKI